MNRFSLRATAKAVWCRRLTRLDLVSKSFASASILGFMLAAAPALATAYFWAFPTDGNFVNPISWTPLNVPGGQIGPGGATDTVNFNQGLPPNVRYTVTSVAGQNDRLLVLNDSLTLNIPDGPNANDYVLLGTSGDSFVVGDTSVNSGNVIIAGDSAARLQSQTARIGNGAGAMGVVTVDTLQWVNSGNLIIGAFGTGTLTIQNGGRVANSSGQLGSGNTATGTATVTGAGSTWTNSSGLIVGNVRDGTLTIQNGGSVSSFSGSIASGSGSHGTVMIDGANSTWIVTDVLEVAHFAQGTLTISNGGSVSNANGFLGGGTASTGTVTIGGPGSRWTSSQSLFVGGNSTTSNGTGILNVNSSGVVNVGDKLKLWNRGTVNLNGGTINAASLELVPSSSSPFPTFNFNSGTFRFTGNATLDGSLLDTLLGPAHALAPGKHLAVSNTATLSAPLRLNGGTLSIGSIANISQLDFDAGTLNITADNLSIGGSGLFGPIVLIDPGKTINVTHMATIDAGSSLVVAGGFSSGGLTNNGDLVVANAAIGGAVTNNRAVTVLDNMRFDGAVRGAGNYFGLGSITFNGGFAPGASPAAVHFDGNAAFTNANTLDMELGGTTAGTQYDSLQINGSAVLGGNLDVSLISGFVPHSGDMFTVITAVGGLSGRFAETVFPKLNNQLNWKLTYGPNSIVLSIIGALEGDYNHNGIVDAADYVVWRKTLGQTGTGLAADGNANNQIDQGDFDIWHAHLGQTAGSGASVTAVPEPPSIILLFVTLAVMAKRRLLPLHYEIPI